jgi:hypothetical protein
MRYQIRLIDQNLPGLAREIALGCWRIVDGLVPERVGNGLYRSLYRATSSVLKSGVEGFRYCGAAHMCEFNLPRAEVAREPAHERYAGEHVHVFLTHPETPPDILTRDLLHATLRAVVSRMPGRRLKRLADLLKNHIAKTLEGRVFPSTYCSHQTLCHANEAYDPWDMTDPINAVAQLRMEKV